MEDKDKMRWIQTELEKDPSRIDSVVTHSQAAAAPKYDPNTSFPPDRENRGHREVARGFLQDTISAQARLEHYGRSSAVLQGQGRPCEDADASRQSVEDVANGPCVVATWSERMDARVDALGCNFSSLVCVSDFSIDRRAAIFAFSQSHPRRQRHTDTNGSRLNMCVFHWAPRLSACGGRLRKNGTIWRRTCWTQRSLGGKSNVLISLPISWRRLLRGSVSWTRRSSMKMVS